MIEPRVSHSSFESGNLLSVFCGFCFQRGPLDTIEIIDLIACENSRGHSVQWSLLYAVKPCWQPLVFIRVAYMDDPSQYLMLVGGQAGSEYLDDV